jgi:tRNA threonylcarbamoyladenosine biosynthesis protein TsaE
MPVYRTRSEEETIAAGRDLARRLPRRAVVLLIGNLGAGKTTLAKGIAEGLGAAAAEEVSSPTFTVVHEYGGGRVLHIDLYRIEDAAALRTLGIEELLERDAVILVEWGERFPRLWPPARIEVQLTAFEGNERQIEIRSA